MLRFTIRDVLWLTVVVAFGVGWWIDRGKLARKVKMLELHRDWTPLIISPPFGPPGSPLQIRSDPNENRSSLPSQ
jgi:hypothetical protein